MRNREAHGLASIEFPLCLLILFVMVAFPLMDLITLGMRTGFVHYACERAAREATSAPTFVEDRFGVPSAQNSAKKAAEMVCSKFGGIELGEVTTTLVAAPMQWPPGSSIETTEPLPDGAKTKEFLYQYRVDVHAKVDPLITYNGTLFGTIPGFTAPLPIICSSIRVCEKPEGLIK